MNCNFLLAQSGVEWTRLVGSSHSNSSISKNRIELNHMLRVSYTQELEHWFIVFERKNRLVA